MSAITYNTFSASSPYYLECLLFSIYLFTQVFMSFTSMFGGHLSLRPLVQSSVHGACSLSTYQLVKSYCRVHLSSESEHLLHYVTLSFNPECKLKSINHVSCHWASYLEHTICSISPCHLFTEELIDCLITMSSITFSLIMSQSLTLILNLNPMTLFYTLILLISAFKL